MTACLPALALAGAPAVAPAAPGDLDLSFDGDGYAVHDFGKTGESAEAVATTPDGKIVAAAAWTEGPERAAVLMRFLPDGSLDPSFGSGGLSTLALPCGNNSPVNDLHVLADGRVLAAGGCDGDFAVLRFNADGSLDQSFDGDPGNPGGGNGFVRTDFIGVSATALTMSVEPAGGAIVLAGVCCTGLAPSFQDTTLVRYDSEGRLDPGFDGSGDNVSSGNGRVIYALGALGDDRAEDSVALGDGATAIAGFANDNLFVASIDSQGVPVPSFGDDGIAAVDHGPSDHGGRLNRDAAGRFVVANGGGSGIDRGFVVSRLNADGSPDASFGRATVNPSPATPDEVQSVLLQPDGGIVLAGYGFVEVGVGSFAPARLVLVRVRPDGSLDPTFGAGPVSVHSGPLGGATAVAATLDAQGRVLTVGTTSPFPHSGVKPIDFLLARFKTTDDPPDDPARASQPPSNRIVVRKLRRNKRRGTATLIVEVPGPGELRLAPTAALKPFAEQTAGPARLAVPIRARGKAKRRLNRRSKSARIGRLKVVARLAFEPSGGEPAAVKRPLTLLKKRR